MGGRRSPYRSYPSYRSYWSHLAPIPHYPPPMEPPRADWQEARGGRIDPMKQPEGPMDADDRIDEAIAESFPASDPPSWNGGIEEE